MTWSMGNIPAAYWPADPKPTVIINFDLEFKDTAIRAKDFKSLTISNSLTPENVWSYESSELAGRFYTSDNKKPALSLANLYTDNLAENGSVIYLGTYTFKVELNDGLTASKTLNVSAPNEKEPSTFTHAYSPEDFVGKPSATYVALPKRSTIESLSLNPNKNVLIIKFTISDSKVYSGWINFYNQDGKFLGQTKTNFRDFSTGAIHPKLNGGKAFHNDGTANTLRISLVDIEKAADSDFKIADVASIHLALSDGKQYEGKDSRYATYSYSIASVTQ